MAIKISAQLAAWVHAQAIANAAFHDVRPVLLRHGYDELQIRRIYGAAVDDPDGFKAGFSALSASRPQVATPLPKHAPGTQPRAAASRREDFAAVAALDAGAGHGLACDHGQVRVVFRHARPHVVLLANVLTAEECDALIEVALPQLRRADVVDSGSGGSYIDARRTSELTILRRGASPLLARIDQRIARITGIPVERGEPLQVMRYGAGAEYQPHHDYFDLSRRGEAAYLVHGGQRVASLVIYLNDVEAGGETVFPEVGLSVAPAKGSAVYFAYTDAQSRCDPLSFHGGAPVVRGEKWIATRWLRELPFP